METKDGCSKQGSRTQDWTRLRKRPVDAARAGRRARHLGRILFEKKTRLCKGSRDMFISRLCEASQVLPGTV